MQNSGRSVVVVLGPPRSGTSAVCHVLQNLGVDFGDPSLFIDPEKNQHNPIFFELVELNEINEEIIRELGWEYRDFVATPLEEDFSSLLVDKFEDKIARFVESNFGGSPEFGLKDPRFCFTLPLWTTVFGRLGIEVRCLLTQRDGEAVAVSNFRLSPERGVEYSRRIVDLSLGSALNFLRSRDYQSVYFEGVAAASTPAITSLMAVSGRGDDVVRQAISSVLDSKLVHWKGEEPYQEDAAITEEYLALARSIRRFRMPVEGGGRGERAVPDSGVRNGHALEPSFFSNEGASFERGRVKLYFRSSDGSYGEESSIVMPWPSPASVETIEFGLPDGNCASHIRIDPSEFPGAYAVLELIIDGKESVPLANAIAGNGALFELGNGGVGLVANHGDPWLEFKLPEGDACRVTVKMERISMPDAGRRIFEEAALATLFNGLNERVARIDDRIISSRDHSDMTISAELRAVSEKLHEGMMEIKENQMRLAENVVDMGAGNADSAGKINTLSESIEHLRTELLRIEGQIRADGCEREVRVIEMLEEMKSTGIKRLVQRWFGK